MLSAVYQQIQTIQEAVRAGGDTKITIVGKNLAVNLNMAIFITMNPGKHTTEHKKLALHKKLYFLLNRIYYPCF